MKVSFVCTTYRRFYCVRRIIAMYQAQTYQDKELIIFNTDTEHPFTLGIDDGSIIVINNAKSYDTDEDYKNRGEILTDAITHATGAYFMLADDDDLYMKWHIQQAVDGIVDNGQDAWKPHKSMFASRDKIELCQNTMEASVIVKMDRIREIGFRTDLTGYEGLSWYCKLRDEGQLNEYNENYIPSYCFNWSDDWHISGHKQSGDIDNPSNFDNHKEASVDYAREPLTPIGLFELDILYRPYLIFIVSLDKLNDVYFENYLTI